ncbi:hypothetical protein KZ850_31415, partial [Pseudomonas aeruginosa]|nr:hypothetical protein [Pseudomonas aeruginosa]
MATAYCPEGHVSNPDLAGGDENRYEFRVPGLAERPLNRRSSGSPSGTPAPPPRSRARSPGAAGFRRGRDLSLIHISEPTRHSLISYA